MKEEKKLNVKDAYSFAIQYFKELVGDFDCTLEEVESKEAGRIWYITLSYYDKRPKSDLSALLILKKLYKQFGIDAYNGKFLSMKNVKLYE